MGKYYGIFSVTLILCTYIYKEIYLHNIKYIVINSNKHNI